MSHASNALVNQAHQIQQSAGNNLSDIRAIVATTIVCAVVYPSISKDCLCVNLASVGDSGAYILDENSIKPICGGKKSDDILFVENITSCLPDNCCVPDTIQFEILPGQLLLLATDGIGDALGDGTGLVSDTFSTIFRSRIPSIIEFAHLTDFSRKSFIDDRSLVALWPR
jgi:serine/threonine protein phosphatase PrpC